MSRLWTDNSTDRVWTDNSTDRVWTDNIILQVNTPTFDIPSGTYSINATISLFCVIPNSSIYYTTDGSIPTSSSTLYTTPINNFTGTLKVIAISDGYANSEVATASYVIAEASDWSEDRNLGAWDFTEQPDKWGYLNNPRWANTGTLDDHIPCGHWHKHDKAYTSESTEVTITSGPWVAALSQKDTKYVYVYDTELYSIVKIDVSATDPIIKDILVVNDSGYTLDESMGYGNPGAQRGGYCINFANDKVWYLFRGTGGNAGKVKLVKVDISGDTMSIDKATIHDGIINSELITDGCADNDNVFFSTSKESVQCFKFDADDLTLTEDKDFGYGDYLEPLQSLALSNTDLYIVFCRTKAGTNGEMHRYRLDFNFNIQQTKIESGTGFHTPIYQNMQRIIDERLWEHRAYYPSNGLFEERSATTLGYLQHNNQEYLQNILGANTNYIYTLQHNNQAGAAGNIYRSNINSISTYITQEVTGYCAFNVFDPQAWDWTSVSTFNIDADKTVLFRYHRAEAVNYVATFDSDLDLVSDIPLDTYIILIESDAFPDQNTNNEPMVWAMPGEIYNESNNK